MKRITLSKVSVYTIPTETPESDGTLEWNSTTLVLCELWAGDLKGIGYSYAHASAGAWVQDLVNKCVIGTSLEEHPGTWGKLVQQVRNGGESGASGHAISAIDIALWDLRAKSLNISLSGLLGQVRSKVEVYGSGGFTSYDQEQLRNQFQGWLKDGVRKFKMKVGRNPREDASRVRYVRECIGHETGLFVDGNGAYDVQTALGLAQDFANQGVTWFEQPILPSDLEQMKYLRSRLPLGMNLATGEYIYDPSELVYRLESKSEDFIQLDITRCKGLTGYLKCAAACELWNVPVSSHCAPSLHVAVGCALPQFRHIEYFYDHVRIEKLLFEGVPSVVNGFLSPDLSRPGHGLIFKEKEAERYRT